MDQVLCDASQLRYMQDVNHTSNTAYPADNYTNDWLHREWAPWGWTGLLERHPCHTPGKVSYRQ